MRKRGPKRASGILIGYTSRWNPFTTNVNILVKVGDKTMKIPIDYRQQKFIQKEYAVGSKVELEGYNDKWHIKSQLETPGDFHIDAGTAFIPSPKNAYK